MNSKRAAFDSGPLGAPRSPKTPTTTYEVAPGIPDAVAEALRRLDGVKETGQPDQWDAYCPTGKHEKRHLRVTVGVGGVPRFWCHAGCEWEQIHPALLGMGVRADCLGRVGGQTGSTVAPRPRQPVAGAPRPAAPVPLVEEECVEGWYVRLMCDWRGWLGSWTAEVSPPRPLLRERSAGTASGTPFLSTTRSTAA